MSVQYGGDVGTRNEANVAHAWNKYELEILERKLNKHDRETALTGAEKLVYLNKAATNYKAEADECLKAEFEQWLQGMHIDNRYPERYDNSVRDGRAERKRIQATENPDEYVGSRLDEWTPTWWGKAQLTHLPGVREYLREQKIRATENELDMNLLAEFGPQNLEQAWQYFKHWVKKRPLSEAPCPEAFAEDRGFPGQLNPVKRSNFGNMPHHFAPDRIDGFTARPPTGTSYQKRTRRPPRPSAPGSYGEQTNAAFGGASSSYEPFNVPNGGPDPSSSGGGGGLGGGASSEVKPEPEPLQPVGRFQRAAAGVGTAASVVRAMEDAQVPDLGAEWDPTAGYGRPTTPPPQMPNFGGQGYPRPSYTFGDMASGVGGFFANAANLQYPNLI